LLDVATALFVSLTVLVVGAYTLIWFEPRLPINPFPPPLGESMIVEREAGAQPPATRAASHSAGGRRAVEATPTYPPTWTPTATGTATPTRLPSATPLATNTPTATATPYPLRQYTILGMRGRRYPGSDIQITGRYRRSGEFTSYLISYRSSDALRISGMMNVPQGRGPFPVVVLCHGSVDLTEYVTGDGTWRQADYLAQHGYLAIAPDYRNHAASDSARSFMHLGYAEDVLHLISSLPNLEHADPRHVGLWGHSMGGAIALKSAVVSKNVDAVVLLGSVHADERVNYENGLGNGPGVYGVSLLGSPRSNLLVYNRMSPIRYLQYSPPLSIHHGQADEAVPYEWSEELYAAAREQGTPAELYLYPDAGHILADEDWELAMERTVAFYDRYLR
jgi:dienelactone hydrolase